MLITRSLLNRVPVNIEVIYRFCAIGDHLVDVDECQDETRGGTLGEFQDAVQELVDGNDGWLGNVEN